MLTFAEIGIVEDEMGQQFKVLSSRVVLKGLCEQCSNPGGEDYEVESMYPGFAADAAEEGEKAAKIAFKQVAKIEAHHRERYIKLAEMVEAGTVFKREQPIKWKCAVCGYIVDGNEPPPKCPSCKNPKEDYEPASLDF